MNNSEHIQPPHIEASINKLQLILLMAGAVIGVSALYLFFNLKPYFLYTMTGMAALIIGYGLKELLQNDARVVINHQGVLDKRLGLGTILWRDIKRVYVISLNNIDHVCMELYDEDKYLRNRNSIANLSSKLHNTTTKISPFNINTGVLNVETNEIFEAIMRGCEIYAPKQSK